MGKENLRQYQQKKEEIRRKIKYLRQDYFDFSGAINNSTGDPTMCRNTAISLGSILLDRAKVKSSESMPLTDFRLSGVNDNSTGDPT